MNRAMVVGGSGFIGSHVVEELLSRNYYVLNYDLVPFDSPATLSDSYLFIQGSMLDYAKISNAAAEYGPEYIYNFAAIAGIDDCQKNPLNAIRKNIVGHSYVLQSALDYSEITGCMPKIVFASSVYVYNENSGFYGATKNCCEVITRQYFNRYEIPYVLLRYGTVYGPKASKGNSIDLIIRRALNDKTISYYGTGEEVREYIHVKDAAKYSVTVAEDSGFSCKPVVITGAYPIKSGDMVRIIKDILGKDYKIEFRNEKVKDHYEVTPYQYIPDVAIKYVGTDYLDLGAGLLDLIRMIDNV